MIRYYLDQFGVGARGGVIEGGPAEFVHRIHVGPLLEERDDRVPVTVQARPAQRRQAVLVRFLRVRPFNGCFNNAPLSTRSRPRDLP